MSVERDIDISRERIELDEEREREELPQKEEGRGA